MFSGIIEEFATIVAIQKDRENIDFTLRCSFVDELGIDQSVAHNGVCLTVVRIENGTYTVTAMKETLDRSNLGLLQVGDKVKSGQVLCLIEAMKMMSEITAPKDGVIKEIYAKNQDVVEFEQDLFLIS